MLTSGVCCAPTKLMKRTNHEAKIIVLASKGKNLSNVFVFKGFSVLEIKGSRHTEDMTSVSLIRSL
jgi:hypothetical protein